MPGLQESGTGIGSWVPQLFYDIIARLVPGAVIIGAIMVAIAGPQESRDALQTLLSKPSSSYPSLVVIFGMSFVLSYALGIVFLGLCAPLEWFAFKLAKIDNEFALKYDFVKYRDPPAGSRITKLKAETHMTELLVLGLGLASIINVFKLGEPAGSSRGLLALVLLTAILGSIGALHHFITRQKRAVENYSNLLGYEEWKKQTNLQQETTLVTVQKTAPDGETVAGK